MNAIRRTTPLIVILALGPLSACEKKPGIDDASLSSATVRCYDSEMKLVGGRAEAGRQTCAIVQKALGDIDHDGHSDAVIITASNAGGSGVFYELHPLLWTANGPSEGPVVMLGDRIVVKSLALADGHVQVKLVVAGENDPACCPTDSVTSDFWWDGRSFLDRKPATVVQASGVYEDKGRGKITSATLYYGYWADAIKFNDPQSSGKRIVFVCYTVFNGSKTPQTWAWESKVIFDQEGRMFTPAGGSEPPKIQPLDSGFHAVVYVLPTGVDMRGELKWGRFAENQSRDTPNFRIPIRVQEVSESMGADQNPLTGCLARTTLR